MEKINNQTISILGCGWLGLPLAGHLLQQGWLVKGSTTREEKLELLNSKGIEGYCFQVTSEGISGSAGSFFESSTLLINIPPGRKQPNVESRYPAQIKAILNQAKLGKVQSILFIGSTGVFGAHQGIVNEHSPADPDRPTGRALVEVEEMLKKQEDFQYSIIRMGGLVGPKRHPGRFLAGRTELTNPNGVVNMIHLADCIGIIETVLSQQEWGATFHGVHSSHPTRQEYYTEKAQELGLEAPTFTEGGRVSKQVNSLVEERLGYTFKQRI